MLERLLIVIVTSAVAYLAYRVYCCRHQRQATVAAQVDPLLGGLKPNIPTIVYFTTPMCVPCKTQQQPALQKLQTEVGEGVQIIKVDATEDADAAARWGVFTAPTTFILDGHKRVRGVNYGVADSIKLRQQLAELS